MRLSWLGCRCMYLGIASARGDEFRLGEEGERWGADGVLDGALGV